MKITLDFEQRIWLIETIGSLASTTALIKVADGLIGELAPKEEEVSVEGLNFTADENGLSWDKTVEKRDIAIKVFNVDDVIVDAIKAKLTSKIGDPTEIELKILDLLGI